MSKEENVQIVKDFFAAMCGDLQRLLALSDEDIKWIIPGHNWPGRHAPGARGTDWRICFKKLLRCEPQALIHRHRYHTKQFVKSTNTLNSATSSEA